MDMNIIVAGVGGQGILSIAFVLDNAAMKEGYHFKQAEVHGMSQRGGAVQSHLRFSKKEIWSDLIPLGAADMILSVEPLEALRYYHFLKPNGAVISSATPFINIPDYPEPAGVYQKISRVRNHVLLDSEGLARQAGSPKAQNMVMLGAAADLLPFDRKVCLEFVGVLFQAKGEKAVKTNQQAFEFGERMAAFFRAGMEAGLEPDAVRTLCAAVDPASPLENESLPVWKEVFAKNPKILEAGGAGKDGKIPGTAAFAREVLGKGAL